MNEVIIGALAAVLLLQVAMLGLLLTITSAPPAATAPPLLSLLGVGS